MRLLPTARLLLAMAAMLTFGATGVALAQGSTVSPSDPGDRHFGFVGSIKGTPVIVCGYETAGSFVLTLKRQGGNPTGDVTIKVNSATKFKVPGDKSATLCNPSTFKDGSRVAVLADKLGNDFFALHVNLIPDKDKEPLHAQRVGIVTACSPNCDATPPALTSITLALKKGGTSTFPVPTTATLTSKNGGSGTLLDKRVTVILKRNPDGTFSVKQILVFRKPGKS